MDKYYYMVSQLPLLYMERPSPMSIKEFMGEARKWLNPRDYAALARIDLFDTSVDEDGPRLWREYKRFEFDFRSDLSLWRKAHREGEEYKPESFPLSLVREGNPLEVEKKLLEHRWNFLEEKETEHHFDLEFLILYYLKLQILRRLSLFDSEKGMAAFQEISRVRL